MPWFSGMYHITVVDTNRSDEPSLSSGFSLEIEGEWERMWKEVTVA
jgi:hypothetical protein